MSKRRFDYVAIYTAVKNGMTREEAVEKFHVSTATLSIILTAGDAFWGVPPKDTPLSGYTPRQLMEELKRKGYTGQLKYVKVETIDLDAI